jgi:TRAP-type uncharacterized transport system fused permease subunit
MARPQAARFAAGWTCLAVTLFFAATGMLYPWYLAWSWSAIFVRWRAPTRVAAVLLTMVSLLWMLAYSIEGREDRRSVQRFDFSAATASSTSVAWTAGSTLGQTLAILPSGPTRKLTRDAISPVSPLPGTR